jgi:large subunit ribosomal protein L23
MALFNKTTEKTKKAAASATFDIGRVILNPHITEKAAVKTGDNVYVFEVSIRATKQEVAKAINALYKVTPRKVNMVRFAPRKVAQRSRKGPMGTRSGMKKAYVYLKKEDKIEFV